MPTPTFPLRLLPALAGGAAVSVVSLVNNTGNLDASGSGAASVVSLACLLAVSVASSYFATRAGDGPARATVAGLTAGALAGLIGALTLIAITFVFIDSIRHNDLMRAGFAWSGAPDLDRWIVEDNLGASAIIFVAGTVLGLAGGAVTALAVPTLRRLHLIRT